MSFWNTIGNTFLKFGSWASSQVTPTSLSANVHAVQAACVEACGFLPTAESVAGIFAAGIPEFLIATTVANAVCAAVNAGVAQRSVGLTAAAPRAASLSLSIVTLEKAVAGKLIQGTFLKG